LTLSAGELEGELPLVRSRQHDLELSEKSGLRLDIYAAAVLLYDDVVAHRQTKPGTFARGLGRENGLNIFSSTSSGIPVPLSRIRISTVLPRFFVAAISTGSKASPSTDLRWATA